MKHWLAVLLLFNCVTVLRGQTGTEPMEGTISYVTTQNVYVKFPQTQHIQNGDTLFIKQGALLVPALIVKEHSSISCVCETITTRQIAISDNVYHKARPLSTPVPKSEPQVQPAPVPVAVTPVVSQPRRDSVPATPLPDTRPSQVISGFASVASFTNFSTNTPTNSERMKYTVSFNTRNIARTGLSFESYLVFTHDNRNWSEIQKDIFNGLKVYNLSLNYDFSKKFSLLLGRKINPKLANMGAVDGMQFEMRFKPVSAGLIAGFRPDTLTYGFNSGLFQFGGYLYNEFAVKRSRFMTTLGFIDQMNHGNTDRQFIYFQHSNSIIRKINIFGSFELDLYNQRYDSVDSTFKKTGSVKLTNLYISVNYRIIQQLSVSFSYSARKNIIYYETYKSYLDRLLDEATLQGYMLQVLVRPVSKLSIGITGSYRFKKDYDPRRTKNIYGYITYSQVPGIGITPTLSYTWLQTSYLQGQIYSIGISRDFFKGKVASGLSYRYVDYDFSYSETNLPQNMFEIDLTWRMIRKLALSVYYEGTFEAAENFNRIYAQIHYRF